jgi:hypothetical protein
MSKMGLAKGAVCFRLDNFNGFARKLEFFNIRMSSFVFDDLESLFESPYKLDSR